MNAEKLFESIGALDDDILQRSERKPASAKRLSLAACLVLILAAAFVLPQIGESKGKTAYAYENYTLESDINLLIKPASDVPSTDWDMHCNSPDSAFPLDSSRVYYPGYFTEELSKTELAAVIPDSITDWTSYTGFAGFDGEGNLLHINLNVTAPGFENGITVIISPLYYDSCCMISESDRISNCRGVEFSVYEYSFDDIVSLDAYAEINGLYFTFRADTSVSELTDAKDSFKKVLECFTWYSESKPDLSSVTYEYIPQWFEYRLTYEEGLEDETFGSYIPVSIPDGFHTEFIVRRKNQSTDSLSCCWTHGYDQIDWNVSYFTEADEARLTSVRDTENYDLALYPIPRADSVPEDKREIVDDPIFDIVELTADTVWKRAYKIDDAGDSDGYRMSFSVRYGDVLVHVSTKGVSPDWLYEQLISLQ